MRLIDASTLKKAILEHRNDYIEDNFFWSKLFELIDNAPTVEYPFYQEAYQTGYEEGYLKGVKVGNDQKRKICDSCKIHERPQGKWLITAEDSEGIHRIQCPFCRYEKGSDFIDYIIVTFEKLPPFCESCGAELRGDNEGA